MNLKNCKAYELVEEKELSDIHSKGYILRHKKTGAKISLIANEDPNKVFYVGFRTPCADSTGVAHIVEHTVLCGSKSFPAKDPFVELVKGSLNTFLNAMTYPDKTIYPVASLNDTDFQNLMHVYLDAVFYPNIYQYSEIFQQEGWHYELEEKDGPITLNGVVYNEMKGAFSSPESVLERYILHGLFPDTSYRHESGGDPEEIPNLTYEDFLRFHQTYYHPSNSYLYLYGNMDMEEKLNWIDKEYLSKFEYLEIDSSIALQKAFSKPVEIKKEYPISSSESVEDNTYLSCNYAIDTILNEKLYIAFDVLEYVLLGAPGAPLKKALLHAGIGKDVMSSYDCSTYQPIFSIIVKNSNPQKQQEFLEIIDQVLKEQIKTGLNKKSILAGLNSFEFKYREADFGNYPKGLLFGIQCLDSWLYDDNHPFTHLEALDVIRWLKAQIETDYYEKLVEQWLLKNPHKASVMIEPCHGLNAKKEQQQKEKLEAYKASLSQEEVEELLKNTKHLKEYQETPSTKEELETIPMLSRKDLKKEAEPFCNQERKEEEIPVVFHNIDSNGIAYVNFLFDTSKVAKEDIPYLGLLRAVLGYVDTELYTYGQLSDEINLYTGGISNSITVYSHLKQGTYCGKFEIQGKSLYENFHKAVELVGEILSKSRFTDAKRIYEIIARIKSRLEMSLSASGHQVSAVRAMSYFSETALYSDMTSGIAFYQLICQLEEEYENYQEVIAAKLQELTELIFRRENLLISFGSEEAGYAELQKALPGLLSLLWDTQVEQHQDSLVCTKLNEGFMDASQVQYVARAGNFKKAGFSYTGELSILKVILSYEYLWQNVRVLGGAYGCMSNFTRNGNGYFTSYRDPNLEKTNEVYKGIVEYLRNFTVEERDMTKYVIGTISNLDVPLTPYTRTRYSMGAYLTGLTFEEIQKEREEILEANQESIRKLADIVAAILEEDAICVIGNEEKLKEQKQLFMELKNLYGKKQEACTVGEEP